MVDFAKMKDVLDRRGVWYDFNNYIGKKVLSYSDNGKFYKQVYDDADRLISYTIENPQKCEKISAEIDRLGDDYTSIYKTKETPMGYFTHNVEIYKDSLLNKTKSVKKGPNNESVEQNVTAWKNSDGTFDVTKETIENGITTTKEEFSWPKDNILGIGDDIYDPLNPMNQNNIASPFYNDGFDSLTGLGSTLGDDILGGGFGSGFGF